MDIKPIKSEADYNEALQILADLWNAKEGTEDFDKLDIMATLVEKYEDNNFKIEVPDPIQAILFRMDQQNISHQDMTKYLGNRSKVSEILNYRRVLSINMMRNINSGLGIPMDVLTKQYALKSDTRSETKARKEANKKSFG